LAILIHSLSDFGQHVPANAFLSAIFCALLLALTRIGQNGQQITQTAIPFWKSACSVLLRIAVFLVVFGIYTWSFIGADNERIAESHWSKVLTIEEGLVEKNWQGTDAEYAELISYATVASERQPENIEYRYWLNVYRWYKISRTTDLISGVFSEDSISTVRDIVNGLHKTRRYCPTFGATYCTLGQIEKLVLDDDVGGAERIRKGFRLAPCDPIVCLVVGCLDIEEDKIEQSFEKFKKAVQIDGKLFNGIVDIYINGVDRPDLAVAIAEDNMGWLSHVANVLADMEEHKDIVEKAQSRVVELLREKCSGPNAPASALASLANIYRKDNDNEAAIEYYYRALALDYSQVGWRFVLAKLLAESGKISEAIYEARICLKLRPQLRAAEELIAELSVHPNMLDEEGSNP
jgi:tetratricopeptide (TPR) repeat protein